MGSNGHFENSPATRRSDLLAEELLGEYVVYDSERKKAHHLNPTLSWIWKRCDGTQSETSLAGAFEQEFKVDNGKEVVSDALQQLLNCELLDVPASAVESARKSGGMSRRSLVTSGAFLWPAVLSIAAPAAAVVRSRPSRAQVSEEIRSRVEDISTRVRSRFQ